ncbi:MAG: hypothetical protein Q4P78_06320 [Rothia sp. (in: high G+C Gram-positive bacteria)]|uniref:hypothetical protein n=1 Tax=Rothia sp. (in: high G+C Gram-positive bacteria) TaxID=1885016 RepID=UPI0026DEB7B1|nr:hypothetical protein [Rothia sp. (in: high G+C Gram-positive bacteria)]MDO5750804.1 hypothetical protein [Rothia sp. (in: high G+C Gram-positive bacteria)]
MKSYKKLAIPVIAVALAAGISTPGQAIHTYNHAGYWGGGFQTNDNIPTFGEFWWAPWYNHNDQTSSIDSENQNWMVYQDSYFRGQALDLKGRNFSNLAGYREGLPWWWGGDWNDSISSAKRI